MTTTPLAVQTWKEIVGSHAGDEAASIALTHLHEAPWLASLGRPSSRDREVLRVGGWPQAFRMFADGIADIHASRKGTSTSGTLNAPIWLLLERLDADDALHRKTADVANNGLFGALSDRHYAAAQDVAFSIPADAQPDPAELEDAGPQIYAIQTIGDYLQEYIRLLFIEIYDGDVAEPRCTHFRDQLGWFLAGFLPCGWDGTWPRGRLKVF